MKPKKIRNNKIGKLGVFEKTKQLGRVISHQGSTEVLYSLVEKPKQYKELAFEARLSNTTLERVLKELQGVQIIKKMPITSKKRETHQYDLTVRGIELMKFIEPYEKEIKLPLSQQKIIEIEKD